MACPPAASPTTVLLGLVAKTALLEAAQASGDAAFAAQQKSAPADRQPTPAQQVKLQTDALLDALILRLESAHRP